MIRGKILRDASLGAGLASAAGQQYTFMLENHWRSDDPPGVGMLVDIELGQDGELASVRPVNAQAQTREAMQAIGLQFQEFQHKGLPALKTFVGAFVVRVGWTKLALLTALAFGWLAFATISVRLGGSLSQSLSLHDVLILANAGNGLASLGDVRSGSTGFYGLLMWLALLAPLLPNILRRHWAQFGLFAPLGFMLFTTLLVYSKISSSAKDAGAAAEGFGGTQAALMVRRMADEMLSQILQAISLGFGIYLSFIAALVLAAIGLKTLLVNRQPNVIFPV